MAAVKTNVGIMKCEGRDCGHDVMVKENEAGTLTYQCGLNCDVSSFAKRGTKAQARWRAAIRKAPESVPAAPAEQAPESVPKAAKQEAPKPAPEAPAAPVPKAEKRPTFDPFAHFVNQGKKAA